MPTYIPETCVVIASIRQDGKQHSEVDKRLSSVPPREVKLLFEVYSESNRKFQDNAVRALKPLRDAINVVAIKYSVPPDKLDPKAIDEVVAHAISKNKRHEGFYGWVAWTMNQLHAEEKNPFIYIFSVAFESSSVVELGKLHTLFRITDPAVDCLRCETPDEKGKRAEIETALRNIATFFRSKRTLTISTFAVKCW